VHPDDFPESTLGVTESVYVAKALSAAYPAHKVLLKIACDKTDASM
jgi:hypothetical protein